MQPAMPDKGARLGEKPQKEQAVEELSAVDGESDTDRAERAVGPSLLTRRTWRPGRQRPMLSEKVKAEETSNSAAEPQRRPKGDDGKASTAISRVIEQCKCPISHQLLVDPVMAEDGVIYERKCIERWLREKRTSPATNTPMGRALVPALAARQTVGSLVEDGLVDCDTSLGFLLERGRMRSLRRDAGGPDLQGALKDFSQALAMAPSDAQRRSIELQIKLVAWMQEGPRLLAGARGKDDGPGDEELPDLQSRAAAAGDAQELSEWMVELGGAVRDLMVTALAEGRRLREWVKLPRGTRVKVVDSAEELRRLCELPAPGAAEAVEWNPDMASWAGAVCTVKRRGRQCMKDYLLHREASGADHSFQFPFNALFLLAEGDGSVPAESSTVSEGSGGSNADLWDAESSTF